MLSRVRRVLCTAVLSASIAGGTLLGDVAGSAGTVVDTTPPTVQITAAPPASTNSRTARFSFATADDSAELEVTCQLDGGGFLSCASPVTYDGLGDGPHAFEVRAIDASGNVGASSHSWTVGPVALRGGDILVTSDAGPGGTSAILRIDPVTGAQTGVADGGFLVAPRGIAIGAGGELFVVDVEGGAVIQVEPTTGDQMLLAMGGHLIRPHGIAIEPGGNLVVVTLGDPELPDGKVVRIDPSTGAQAVVAAGGALRAPAGVAVAGGGDLFVADISASDLGGAILRVDPATGVQATVAASGLFRDPIALVIDPSGDLFVADYDGAFPGRIIRASQGTGAQSVVTEGGMLDDPVGVARARNGELLVADFAGRVVRIDPSGGQSQVAGGGHLAGAGGLALVPDNFPPVARDDSYSTDEDVTLSVPPPGVLGNDTDFDTAELRAVLVSAPTQGSVVLNPDGSFVYTPNANATGIDTFTYRATDGGAVSNMATVTISVTSTNDAPIARDDVYWISEDSTLQVDAPGLLGNDVDADADALSAVLVSGPAFGNLTLATDGSFVYTPVPNFSGTDSFTYRARDATGAESNAAAVLVTVGAINDPPVASPDGYGTQQNVSLTVAAPGVLGNDSDVDGDGLAAVLVTGPAYGFLTLRPDGSFTYVPTTGFLGPDGFTYNAVDPAGAASNTVAVTITVTPPMVPSDLVVATLSAPATAGSGSTISATTTVKNQASGSAPASVTRFYLSTDSAFGPNDTELGSLAVPLLSPGATSTGSTPLVIPAGTPDGTYFIIARADADNITAETSETNNTKVKSTKIGPDLTVSSLAAPATAGEGVTITVTDITKNAVTASPAGPSTTQFYLSTDSTFGGGDIPLGSRTVPTLLPGQTSTAATPIMIPAGTAPGTYFIIARADANNSLPAEINKTNNTKTKSITIGPDLTLAALGPPAISRAGLSLTITDTTSNSPTASRASASTTRFYLSTDAFLGGGDVELGSRTVPALGSGESSTATTHVTIPAGTPPANYFLIAKADADNNVPAEISEANNTAQKVLIIAADSVAQTRPNIIVILTDDQRYDTTWAMPRLLAYVAQQGVTFTNGFVSFSLCCPSRASLLTGLYAMHHGVKGNGSGAARFGPMEDRTVNVLLQSQGYVTGYFGKYLNDYHLISPHVPVGWDRWFAFKTPAYFGTTYVVDGVEQYRDGFATTLVTDELLAFLQRSDLQPFFAIFAPYAPHTPSEKDPALPTLFGDYVWSSPALNEADVSDKPPYIQRLPLVSSLSIQRSARKQLNALQAVDIAVERIVSALAAAGKLDNTYLLFTSDNGLGWSEHRLADKPCEYEGCIRVPMLVRGPGIPENVVRPHLVVNIDITPTILEWAGIGGVVRDGSSWAPILADPSAPWRAEFLIEQSGGAEYTGVRTAEWKYVKHTRDGSVPLDFEELYDLLADPYELNNVARDPAYAGVLIDMRVRLARLKEP